VVQNNLQKKPVSGYSSGIGLENIRSRLHFISGKNLMVSGNETEFTVKVPLIAKEELDMKW
jgi:signal transduction histidine kinase